MPRIFAGELSSVISPASRLSPADPNFAIEVIQSCLTSAIQCGASDVHIQPRMESWEISFRIDGVLQPVESFPRSDESDPVARLMALAGLPSYRMGVPQEGPLRWRSGDAERNGSDLEREMRLGVFPTVHGNRAAIRIMEERESVRQLHELGLGACTLDRLQTICDARDGWLLVAGPAGSGKTTTLYACLSHIAGGEFRRSVLSIEDPIESVIDSISQSQLQSGSGLTLASAMRAAVRQDAEVLLVSEIRDVETAEAVLAASMTGHLCFSSIHAGTVGGTLRRLVQMNLPTFAIQSGLRGVMCQRLLRRRCDACDAGPKASRDCSCCHGTGYAGRVPVSQIVDLNHSQCGPAIFDALAKQLPALELDRILEAAGIESLRHQAERLIEERVTDQEEVFRVLGRTS
ncbi:MAG TPA: general secretion pathway protein GspE [Rhodopirellula baltica]|uniref:General secretion pathway protein E n=1 Tax=Rhodopirellula baltica (strain DSM 10527 / NCIMB 13988 / SH1) TaxID=243090 RepID=Q7UZ83_RHOBA|nr:ATPase, T2SS/T4P/T4SS family [Rhodopirellula baltica]CAD71400.1 general secretion pathway protein E [Rhodopirellula baltica SH 1]HBE65564.1 general secretion pathway protein GspE [Rhodopirellula baltica]